MFDMALNTPMTYLSTKIFEGPSKISVFGKFSVKLLVLSCTENECPSRNYSGIHTTLVLQKVWKFKHFVELLFKIRPEIQD